MLASALTLGLVTALATGGDLRRLGEVRINLWPLLILAISLRVVALVTASAWLFGASLLGIALVAGLNYRLPGLSVVAFGTALNFAAVVANSGMPTSAGALTAAGASLPNDGVHILMSTSTFLNLLGDVIPVSAVRGVYSFGDVLSGVGAWWFPLARSHSR
jgi:Family of unknown function (DUF5317)